VPAATRIYDLNLRPGFDSPALVADLLQAADLVKLNEEELQLVARATGLPSDAPAFLRKASRRYGWRAACVTRGARGCAMLIDRDYVEADGVPADVVDTVGAGDAFAAAFVHGLVSGWPAQRVADFCNATAAAVVSVHGAIPGA
jgi:fructokinase